MPAVDPRPMTADHAKISSRMCTQRPTHAATCNQADTSKLCFQNLHMTLGTVDHGLSWG